MRGILKPPCRFIEILPLPLNIGIPFACCPLVRSIVRLVHITGVGQRMVMMVVVVVKEMGVITTESVGGVCGVVVGVGVAACITSHTADTRVWTVSVGLTLPAGWSANKKLHTNTLTTHSICKNSSFWQQHTYTHIVRQLKQHIQFVT